MQGTGAKQYKSTLDCFIQIMRVDGISGLYKGLVPRLGRVVPGQGIIFMSFETIQVRLYCIIGLYLFTHLPQVWIEKNFFTAK